MEKRKREIVLGGYGKQNEQGICFAEFAPEQGSLRKISGIGGLSAPTYLAILKKGGDRILYTFERSGQGGAVVALLLSEKGAQELSRFTADWIGPCHISVSEKEDLVYCASYGKGTSLLTVSSNSWSSGYWKTAVSVISAKYSTWDTEHGRTVSLCPTVILRGTGTASSL